MWCYAEMVGPANLLTLWCNIVSKIKGKVYQLVGKKFQVLPV